MVKHTGDEYYTQENDFQWFLVFFENVFQVDTSNIIRPFWPGGDYEQEDYTDKIVMDNPPFSKQKEIIRFYMEKDIPFVLWCDGNAGGLTKYIQEQGRNGLSVIYTRSRFTFKNGKATRCCFVSNMIKPAGIYIIGQNVVKRLGTLRKNRDKNVWCSIDFVNLGARDGDYFVPWDDCEYTRQYNKLQGVKLHEDIGYYRVGKSGI